MMSQSDSQGSVANNLWVWLGWCFPLCRVLAEEDGDINLLILSCDSLSTLL